MQRRILFRLGDLPVHAYPAMLYLGLVMGVWTSTSVAAGTGLPLLRTYAATLILLVPALAGARLLYVVANWGAYWRAPRRILRSWEGGASLYGGLLVSVAVSLPLLEALDVPFWPFWDVSTFTILVGMAPTKIGCFLNGCCAGRPTTSALGLVLPDHRGIRARRVPVQLLEAGLALVLLTTAAALWSRRPFDGAIFLVALLAYAVARAPLESLRDTAAVDRARNVRVNLLLSVGLAVAGALGLVVLALR